MAKFDRKTWLSPRALKLHAVILIVVPAFMALCVWQIYRATGGNNLSWAYVFEWPLFAGYAVYMWWRFLHEDTSETPSADTDTGSTGRPTDGDTVDEDPELVAYNAYLAQLADQDQARHPGRKS